MSENKTEDTKYMEELKDIVALETAKCKQERILKAYADYMHIPKEPPPYRNTASLGMITLSGAWVLFDAFAFYMKYIKIGIGTSIFTGALILFFIALHVRGTKAYKRLMAEYEEYVYVYQLVKQLEETNKRTRRELERLYEKYDKEMQKGHIPDKSRELENDITSAEQIAEYCKEMNRLLDSLT